MSLQLDFDAEKEIAALLVRMRDTEASIAKGAALITERMASGQAVPPAWTERAKALGHQRTNCLSVMYGAISSLLNARILWHRAGDVLSAAQGSPVIGDVDGVLKAYAWVYGCIFRADAPTEADVAALQPYADRIDDAALSGDVAATRAAANAYLTAAIALVWPMSPALPSIARAA